MVEVERVVFRGSRVLLGAGAAAVAGLLGCAIGLALEPDRTYAGYLVAFAFVASIAVGALVFLMTAYAVNAAWNVVLRRLNEAVISVFPALALLFLPIALGLDRLYVWVSPPAELTESARRLLEHKQGYLNGAFFVVRSALYLALWLLVATLLRRWSLARDRRVAPSAESDHARERAFSCALLPLVALALTFAAFDWLMSLEPLWFSSLFGVYYFSGGFVACFGLLAVLCYSTDRSGMARELIRPSHYHALGRLMLGFTVFWAYSAYFQAMLIKMADKPEEVEFYLHRTTHGWELVAWALIVFRFVVPFFVLLPRAIKFRGGAMALVGGWILVGHYVDMFWLVTPSQRAQGPLPSVWDLSALLAVGGSCTAYAAWRLRGRAVVPIGDPLLARSIAYRSPL